MRQRYQLHLTALSEPRPAGRNRTARLLGSALVISALGAAQATSPAAGEAHPDLWPRTASRGLIDARTEAFVSDLLARMSLEEKVGQMIQGDISSVRPEDLREVPLGSILAGGNSPPLGKGATSAPDASIASWVATAQAFRRVSVETRPGHTPIPVIFGVDAVHGNSHVVGATVFPHNIGLGAAHDPELVRRIGEATAQETAAAGFDWAFGPTLAVPQDERWGRHYEGYSEDPALVRAYAAAMVRGLQGEPGLNGTIQAGHVAAAAKHFLADGGTRDGIDQGDADIGEATLIGVHAQGYPAAIEAGVMTIMASFSSWHGVKMTGNRSLLTGVLKQRMGFDGFVVSDWNSHGQVPGCTNQSCPAAVNAGIDMLMAPGDWKALYRNMVAQVRAGDIPLARVDDAVRRILRVKARLGLFDPARPWEGRAGVLASPEHRALAREAVRKSLVLLKNNAGVLPLRASGRVLVAGPGADDIGFQSGGWTLSWQGGENRNGDFPQGQSIYAALREAIGAGGGSVELSTDGRYVVRPDVAVVVFGEHPYAEGWGDLKTLEYQSGDKRDLALLRRLKAQGIAVVSVFLSGRPLWVNPEINASDAFVAAWLPGSEGGGVADVLVGDASKAPRHDFVGRLAFSWPRTAAQTGRSHSVRSGPPQFATGDGLSYEDRRDAPALSEVSGVRVAAANFSNYLIHGHAQPPWKMLLRHGDRTLPLASGAAAADVDRVVSVRAVDAGGVQEGGRQLTWSGRGPGEVAIAGPPLDMRMLSNGEASLQLDFRLDEKPSALTHLAIGCGPGCGGAVDLTPTLSQAPPGQWRSLKIKLSCFRDAGADVSKVTEPFVLNTSGRLRLSLATVQLSSDPAGAICPR
ncbi:MAG TPA: exo 1,3/1,4-beta-D-glucan glucohydrolase [Burkholderiaceae bacterium]|nr:exo 1,3/1,4-beta-D-glucan glucohydrolase [Burkholderiaceae bacterium]